MKTNWIYLSFPLNSTTPTYGGGQGFFEKKDKQMHRGDSCNTSQWSFSSHTGTHIDFPRHFAATGPAMDAYPPEFFMFETVFLADISVCKPGQIITPESLNLSKAPQQTDLLLIKTGFGAYRTDAVYWQENPGFHPDMAVYLRQHLPSVRVMGFDSISLSSFANRGLGRLAHTSFLDHDQPILLLEDMNLEGLTDAGRLRRVIVAPVWVTGADGAPCTVFGELNPESEKL